MALGAHSLPSLLRRMEEGRINDARYSLHGHLSQIPRMRRTAELLGHTGCVNRLAFNADASTLISASDDCTLRIWDVASLTPRAIVVPGHVSNVFGVDFMPHTNDTYVCSAGLDAQVRHTNVLTGSSTLWTCHDKVVKTVVAVSTNVFISASKDGTARLFDTRIPRFHPKYAASNVIIRITSAKRARGLHSAILSPVSDNHLLVAAQEPCVRIYDLRKCGSFVTRTTQQDHQLHHTSVGDCIERICPPHMHESAPETGTKGTYRKRTYATFATYSPDGKQIVASFFEDMVHVFDLSNRQHPTTCRSPFMSRAHKRIVIFRLMQDAVCDLASYRHARALGRANKVLQFDPDNVLALAFRAEALIRRNSYGDLRSSFATLAHLINILQMDHTRIAELWGTHTPDGPLCMSPQSSKCAVRAEIWIKVFQYKQASVLFRMAPTSRREIYQSPSSRIYLKKRLEHLDTLIAELERYRETMLCPKLKHVAQERALGDVSDEQKLYSSFASKARGETLERFFDSFFEGVPTLRKAVDNSFIILRQGQDLNLFHRYASESIDSCSTDSEEEGDEEKHEGVELFSKLQRQVGNLEEAVTDIWGPPPSAQQGWRSFYGHTSKQTDIKEARFYGAQNQVILSGSDDGRVHMWAAKTGELLARVPGDDQIVNCVLPHPTRSMIINSGIDNTIKVVTPEARPGT